MRFACLVLQAKNNTFSKGRSAKNVLAGAMGLETWGRCITGAMELRQINGRLLYKCGRKLSALANDTASTVRVSILLRVSCISMIPFGVNTRRLMRLLLPCVDRSPSPTKANIRVESARNLKAADTMGTSDPFVKVSGAFFVLHFRRPQKISNCLKTILEYAHGVDQGPSVYTALGHSAGMFT